MEAIGHLAGGIAHDFNNILTSVMGYVVLAAERQEDLGDARLARYLDQAQQACTRARDLIQKMLTFSRGRGGEARPLSLAPLVKEAVKLLRSTLPATVELQTQIEAELPPVRLDPVQVEQVLLNLCINARDAMKGSGRITVRVRMAGAVEHICASCRMPVKGTRMEFSVEDSGPGIAPELLDRIFEPFFSTKEVGKGSGMGLSSVHGIVHEHGGHIVVDSAPGAGAAFRVLLEPLIDVLPDAPIPRRRTATTRRRSPLQGRVLVVDDEPMVAESMAELLQSWGLSVTVQISPVEARMLLRTGPQRFDLVIADQTMPKLTGLELASEVVSLRPELPVILYSGYSDTLSADDVRRAGVSVLVRKPVEPAVLYATLLEHLPKATSASRATERS